MNIAILKKMVFAIFFVALLGIVSPNKTMAASMPVTGYAWSSEAGWISFSNDVGATITYGVSEDSVNGNLSGYAWSSNLGWISFNSAHVPSVPRVNTGGSLQGWARICAAYTNKSTCGGSLDPNSGGWDGLISLSGTAVDNTPYGVIQDTTTCKWSGDAWGSDGVGDIRMSGTAKDGKTYGVSVDCLPTATLSATPSTITLGTGPQESTLKWNSTNANSCVSGGGFSTGGAVNGSAKTGNLSVTTNYQVTCTGSAGSDTAYVTVTVIKPTIDSFTTSPNRVPSTGGDVTVGWTVSNVDSCTITKNAKNWQSFSTDASRSATGSATAPNITTQTTFVITCKSGSTTTTETRVVNPVSLFKEF